MFVLLVLLNVGYVGHMVCVNSKAKKRKKWLEQMKTDYQKAQKEAIQKKKDDKRNFKLARLMTSNPLVPIKFD